MKAVLIFVIGLTLTCTFAIPSVSLAVDTPISYTLLAPLPCIATTTSSGCTPNSPINQVNFQQYVTYAINLLIALAAVAAVFMIVWGGFEYMTSASFSTKSDGLAKVRNAVYGLVLVLASYLIIKTIDPRFVNIPTTLVPQLKLKCPVPGQETLSLSDPKCKVNGVMTQAEQDAASHLAQYQTTRQNIATAQSQIASAQTNIDSLNQQIIAATNSDSSLSDYEIGMLCSTESDIQQLCTQRQTSMNDLSTAQNLGVLSTAQSGIVQALQTMSAAATNSNYSSINTAANVDIKMQSIRTLHDNAVTQMRQNTNPPDSTQMQALNDTENYALAMLQMQKDVIQGPSVWSTATGVISSAASSIPTAIVGSLIPAVGIPATLKTFNTNLTNNYQSAMASKFKADVMPYANQISDPNLRNQLIQNANNAVSVVH